MAQPYNDVPRLLPQAYQAPVLIGDGDIFIKKGQYVVIYCSQNAYTYGLSGEFRGDEKAKYRCEFLSEKSQQSDEVMKQKSSRARTITAANWCRLLQMERSLQLYLILRH